MSRRLTAVLGLIFVFAFTKEARPFGLLDASIFRNSRLGTIKTVPAIGVGSVVTYQGRVDSAKISYQENGPFTANAQCEATVTLDNQKTVRAVADPRGDFRPQDPQAKVGHFSQAVVCDQFQTAAAEGWRISFTARVSRMGASDPADVSVLRLTVAPETAADAGGTGTEDYACAVGVCETVGTVMSFTSDLNREETMCQATLKITPPSGNPQLATVMIREFPGKSLPDCGSTYEPTALWGLHAKHEACAALLDAMARNQPVTIDGAVSGSTIYAYSVERKAPAGE